MEFRKYIRKKYNGHFSYKYYKDKIEIVNKHNDKCKSMD